MRGPARRDRWKMRYARLKITFVRDRNEIVLQPEGTHDLSRGLKQ